MTGLTEQDLLALENQLASQMEADSKAAQLGEAAAANERGDPIALLGEKRSPEQVRADAVRKDIFSRHGIEPGTADEDAIAAIMANAQRAGMLDDELQPTGAWANPQERADAQAAYVAAGRSPEKMLERQGKAKYLMDPQTAAYQQNYVRDMDFLSGVNKPQDLGVAAWVGGPMSADQWSQRKAQDALADWDKSNMKAVHRDAWNSPNFATPNDFADSAVQAITNPDLTSGYLMHGMNIPYNFLAMQGSGESDSAGESWRTAAGQFMADTQVRPTSLSPILDLPSDASAKDRGERLRAVRDQYMAAKVPGAAERWERTTGWTPPAFVSDAGDLAMQMIDPTLLFPVAGLAKNAAGVGLKQAAKTGAAALAKDAAQEQVTGAGLLAALGGSDPDREWTGEGGHLDLTPPDAELKSDSDVAAAKRARQELWQGGLARGPMQGVSSPPVSAYNGVQQARIVR